MLCRKENQVRQVESDGVGVAIFYKPTRTGVIRAKDLKVMTVRHVDIWGKSVSCRGRNDQWKALGRSLSNTLEKQEGGQFG